MRKSLFILFGFLLLTSANSVNNVIEPGSRVDENSCVRKYDYANSAERILTMFPVGQYYIGNNRAEDIIAIEISGSDTFWTPMVHTPSYEDDPLRGIQFDSLSDPGYTVIRIGRGFWDEKDRHHFEAADSAAFKFNAFRLGQFLNPQQAVSVGYKGNELLLDARNLNADKRNPLRYSLHKADGEEIDAGPLISWQVKSFDKNYLPKGTHTLNCINFKGCIIWSGEVVVD